MSARLGLLPKSIVITIVATNALGIGLILPVMPDLLSSVGDVDIGRAAAIGGLLSLSFAAMQVLFGPLLGALSDRFGRRPVLITSLVMSALDYAVLALANALWMFFVIRVFAGIASATFSVANAVLADTSAPENRAAQFGLTGAAFGVGFVLGPLFGGILAEFGPRAPFVAAGLLCAAAAVLAFFFLPETNGPDQQRALRWSDCVPFAAFAKLRHQITVLPLFLVQFFDSIAGFVFPAVWAYFATVQFGWTPTMIGLSLGGYGACIALVQAGGVRLLVSRFGEPKVATLGLSLGIIGFIVLSLLSSGFAALLLTPLFASRAISNTAISGLLSRSMPPDQQGGLQGLLAATTGLASLVSIPLMTQVFSAANAPLRGTSWPGAPFFVAAVFSAISLGVLLVILRRAGRDQRPFSSLETPASSEQM